MKYFYNERIPGTGLTVMLWGHKKKEGKEMEEEVSNEHEIWLCPPGWVVQGTVIARNWEHLQQLFTKDFHIVRTMKTVVKEDRYKLED